ncbi:hypothetical protein ACIOD2_41320 [Amycolatopsis sp. NPDC088138]|uniref:hypothetical protein n=1 Tax=Amycolatopsis sp. NPDC088138 TaxID=3363938 RepID=UPI00380EF673
MRRAARLGVSSVLIAAIAATTTGVASAGSVFPLEQVVGRSTIVVQVFHRQVVMSTPGGTKPVIIIVTGTIGKISYSAGCSVRATRCVDS